jgi:hypothetical protein
MSGSTIGGVIGGVIGAYFGNWQLGYAIGSAIGGAIDPTVIKGPSIGDAQQQSSQAGRPIPAIFGHAPPIAATIVDGDPKARKIKRRQTVGKGSGQVQETEGFIATRLFLLCESPGGAANVARIRRNGKLVYSAITGDNLDAESAGFGAQVTILRGGDDQLPHPALEAMHGVGNTPYYRGRLCVLVQDDDETDTRGAANQYLFEVVSSGAVTTTTTTRYVAPDYSRFVNADFPLANPDTDYTFVEATGDTASGSGYSSSGSTIAEIQANVPGTAYPGWGLPSVYLGCMAGGGGPYTSAAVFMQGHGGTADLTEYQEAWLVYNWIKPTVVHDDLHLRGGDGSGDTLPPPSTSGAWQGDALGVVYRTYTTHNTTLRSFPYSLEGFTPLAIRLHTKQLVPTDHLAAGEFFLPDAPGYVSDADGNVRKWGGTATLVSGSFKTLALEALSGVVYTQREIGPVLAAGDADDNATFWNAAYAAAVANGTADPGWTYNAAGTGGPGTYPRATTHAYQLTTSTNATIDPDAVAWKDVVGEIARRCGVPADRLDIDGMTDNVPGYMLARLDLSGSDYVRELCTFYSTDLPEFDDQLHAVRRGGAIVATIDEDLCEVEEEDDDNRPISQQYPQRVTVYYPDPANNYIVTPQVAERTTPDVEAATELNMQCTIPFDSTSVAQKADILQKVAFNQAEGSFKRALPAEYSRLVASDPVMFRDRRYILTKVSYEEMRVLLEGQYDRASAYTSLATGADAPAPQPGTGNLKGPSLVRVIQGTEPLRAADTQAGFYAAVCGKLGTWPGGDLYMSVDGGETEQLVATVLVPAAMGTLTSALAIGGTPLQVALYGDDVLESVSGAQIAARQNAAAIISGGIGGAVEIVQFQDSADTGTRTWDLTTLYRARLGTEEVGHVTGDDFVLLDGSAAFVPLSDDYAGQTIILRAVTRGTAPANNDAISFVYAPRLGGEIIIDGNGDAPTPPTPPSPAPGGAGTPGTPTLRAIGTTVVDPCTYGASPTASAATNSAAFNAAYAALPVGGGIVQPSVFGIYQIDTASPLLHRAKTRLALTTGTNQVTLQAAYSSTTTSPSVHRDIIRVDNVSEWEITGGHLIGYRELWAANGGVAAFGKSEWAHGIFVTNGAYNGSIYDLTAEKFVGDGLSIGRSAHDIHVVNIRSTNNRRQGISTGGDNILVEYCELDHIGGSDGTAPMAGIDIEVDDPATYSATNVTVRYCYIHDNTRTGITAYKSCNNLTLTGNRIEYNGTQGVYAMDSDNVDLHDNSIKWNGVQGVSINGTCSGWDIDGNDFFANSTRQYGVPTTGSTTTAPSSSLKSRNITTAATVTGTTYGTNTYGPT